MLRSNNNIIGYLQKKAFFSKSPSHSPSANSRFNTNNTNPQFNSHGNTNTTPPKTKPSYDSNRINTNLNKNIFNLEREGKIRTNTATNLANKSKTQLTPSKTQEKPKIYDGKLFQSSRVEVKMCMEQLLSRVSVELRMLEGAITQLTVSLQSLFYKKLHELKQEVMQTIDSVFAQARNNLNNVMNHNSQSHLKKLIKARHSLSEADKKLKQFKSGMDSSWRQIAGELLAGEFDQKVEKLLDEGEQIRRELQLNKKQSVQGQQESVWSAVKTSIGKLIQKRCG